MRRKRRFSRILPLLFPLLGVVFFLVALVWLTWSQRLNSSYQTTAEQIAQMIEAEGYQIEKVTVDNDTVAVYTGEEFIQITSDDREREALSQYTLGLFDAIFQAVHSQVKSQSLLLRQSNLKVIWSDTFVTQWSIRDVSAYGEGRLSITEIDARMTVEFAGEIIE